MAWRDLANQRAGGSEVLVDMLAAGMTARGAEVTLLCGGRTAERNYSVVRNGGTVTQFARAPLAYWRRFRDSDLVVEVCNGMPFLTPLWCNRPQICLVNHVHTELWRMMFPRPVAAFGQFAESRVLPWAHRNNLFLTVSNSTAEALREIGIADDRIRQICNGVVRPDPLTPRSPEPMFLALGRLTEYKRIDLLLRLWRRVRPVTGGTLVIAGDGPERQRLEAMAGPGVVFAGRGIRRREAQAAVRGVAAAASGADRGLGDRDRGGGHPRDSRRRLQRPRFARLGRGRRDRGPRRQ